MKDTGTERKHLIIKISVAVVCVVLLATLVAVQYVLRTFHTYRVVHEMEVTYGEGNQTRKLNDKLLLYNKDGMRCMDTKGKMVWDITYQIQEPCVAVDGGVVAVGGYGDHLIHIMDENGRIGEIDTNLPIRNLCVAEAGYVGAVLADNEVYWIYIYDAKGNEVSRARTTMEQSGYPLSVSLSSNAKLLAVSYLYLDAGEVQSNVAFYNMGEVGQNYSGQYMSGYIYEEIIPEIHYMNDRIAMAISSGRLTIYEGSEKPTVLKTVLLNDTVQGVYWGDENVVLVYNGTAEQGRYFMQVYNLAGELVLEKGFDFEYEDIKSQNGIITLYNNSEILVYTLDGRERYNGSLGDNIFTVEPTSRKYRYMVLFDEAYKVIELE